MPGVKSASTDKPIQSGMLKEQHEASIHNTMLCINEAVIGLKNGIRKCTSSERVGATA